MCKTMHVKGWMRGSKLKLSSDKTEVVGVVQPNSSLECGRTVMLDGGASTGKIRSAAW